MESVPRNVILDLLPAYIAGEASEETKNLIEEYAKNDPQIAKYIDAGSLRTDPLTNMTKVPDDLEMKTIKRVRHSIRRKMWYVAIVTAAILLIPLIAMQFTAEVNWGVMDFIIMGVLLLGTGLTYVLISKASENTLYRIAVGIAVIAGLLLIWINLAVGIIGSENNPANLLYVGVLAVGIIGAALARLQPMGMARTMFITAMFQLLVPVIAIIIWKPSLEESPGILGVFILNAFFAALFSVAGILFRRSAQG